MISSSIRNAIRTQRKNLSSDQVQSISQKISEKIIQLPEFLQSQHIAYYISNENEIDPAEIIHHAKKLNKSFYLPIISEKNKLNFYLTNTNTQFIKNKFNIDEPIIKNQEPVLPEDLNLILVPLVAFDQHCNRLGRGMGFYDSYLQFTKNVPQNKRPTLIGLAYEFQKVEKLNPESWDVPMDFVVTEKNIYSSSSCNKTNN